jgi:hypothetical protein
MGTDRVLGNVELFGNLGNTQTSSQLFCYIRLGATQRK